MASAEDRSRVTLRRLRTAADIDILRVLFREYQQAVGTDLCFQGFADEVAGLPGEYAPPRGALWLAADGEAALGCIALRPLDQERAEMKRLYVRPEARGLGLGRRLAEELIAKARRLGYRRVCLDTLPTMPTAQQLYQQLGFVDIAPYRVHPVAGARYMGLKL